MVELTGLIGQLDEVTILVAGDLMQDAYVLGNARRISPEAPVPIVHVTEEFQLPGGAGNVMLNLRALGADVVALGRVGSDTPGETIKQHLQEKGVDVSGIFSQSGYPTPVKNRIIANNQQMVRVDHEVIAGISEELEQQVIESIPRLLEGVQAVAISDYGKGFLSPNLLQALIMEAGVRKIPVIVDPKGVDYVRYTGATIIKPNLSEAYAAANVGVETSLEEVAKKLLTLTQSEMLMVTRSEMGISLFYPDGKQLDFPVKVREVKDVTGAGDTVLAMLTLSIANGLDHEEATRLANVAAGLAIEMLGCAMVTMEQLARRLLHADHVNKVFDEKHLFALKAALTNRRLKIVGLSSERDLSASVLRSIFDVSKSDTHDLLVYVCDDEPDEDFVYALSAIQEVDFVILKGDSLRHLCEEIEADEVYLHDGKVLQPQDNVLSLI
jgi:rfaE bifunctional protein kinase chain/domain